MSKQIVFVTPVPPPYGGIGNWTLLIKDYLSKHETNIRPFFLNTAPNKRSTEGRSLWNRVVVSGIKMLKTIKEFKRLIKNERIDCVHINTSGSLSIVRDLKILKIAKKAKIKTVYHIRFGRVPELLSRKTLESKMLLKAFSYADHVICIDRHTYECVKKIETTNAVSIPNPINPEDININRSKILEKSISYLGWVIKNKGIEELLEAWQTIRLNHREWVLKLIGPFHPDYIEKLKKRFSFEQVITLGEKKHDLAMEEIDRSSIFVLPSYTEGFPNVILEAMFLGKAIIATNVGAISDILSDDCGIVIERQNTAQLRDAIERLIENDDERLKLSINGRKKCESYYISNIFKRYKKIWFDYDL